MHELVLRDLTGLQSIDNKFERLEKEKIPEVIRQLEAFIGSMIDVYSCGVRVNEQGFFDEKVISWANLQLGNKPYRTFIRSVTDLTKDEEGKIIIIYEQIPFRPLITSPGLYASDPKKQLSPWGIAYWTTYYKLLNLYGKEAVVFGHLCNVSSGSEPDKIMMRQNLIRKA